MSNEFAFEMAPPTSDSASARRRRWEWISPIWRTPALVVTDQNVAQLAPVATVRTALEAAGVQSVLFDRVRIEPTDGSFREAIQFAEAHAPGGIVAVGRWIGDRHGQGSELYTTYPPANFSTTSMRRLERRFRVPGPLKPLIAIPTTAGTGSERTPASAIFDSPTFTRRRGLQAPAEADQRVLDPDNTRTCPSGRRIERARHLSAMRSSRSPRCPYTSRPRPQVRSSPAYQGSNPISDILGAAGASNRCTLLIPRSTIPEMTTRVRR
jgi:hydroxyacid-oxoacid transhydrogenase